MHLSIQTKQAQHAERSSAENFEQFFYSTLMIIFSSFHPGVWHLILFFYAEFVICSGRFQVVPLKHSSTVKAGDQITVKQITMLTNRAITYHVHILIVLPPSL